MEGTPPIHPSPALLIFDWKWEKAARDKRTLAERLNVSVEAEERFTLSQIPIEDMGLSPRASNALHRVKCHKVSEVLALSAYNLITFYALGEKSASEIVEKLQRYLDSSSGASKEETEAAPGKVMRFWMLDMCTQPKSGVLLLDNQACIEELGLTPGSHNILKRLGYHTVGQLRDVPTVLLRETLLSMKYMRKKSAEEILRKREAVGANTQEAVPFASKESAHICVRVFGCGQSPEQWIVPMESFFDIKIAAWISAGQLYLTLTVN